jgi:hypothetical protein
MWLLPKIADGSTGTWLDHDVQPEWTGKPSRATCESCDVHLDGKLRGSSLRVLPDLCWQIPMGELGQDQIASRTYTRPRRRGAFTTTSTLWRGGRGHSMEAARLVETLTPTQRTQHLLAPARAATAQRANGSRAVNNRVTCMPHFSRHGSVA